MFITCQYISISNALLKIYIFRRISGKHKWWLVNINYDHYHITSQFLYSVFKGFLPRALYNSHLILYNKLNNTEIDQNHLNLNALLNKTILRSFLNDVNGLSLISVGSEFQTMGAQTLTDRSPPFFSFEFGNLNLSCLSERRDFWLISSNSHRYSGPSPFRVVYVINAIL